MGQYWPEAVFLLETLVLMAKKSDKDGMDLYFTIPGQQPRDSRRYKAALEGVKDEKEFRRAMMEKDPRMIEKDPRKTPCPGTDIIAPMRSVFADFYKTLGEHQKPKIRSKWQKKGSDGPKALTLLVLTNGTWQGMQDPDAINGYLETLLGDLSNRGLLKSGQDRFVSIEFIQFGDDPTVTERLRALDDGMEFKGYE